MDAAVFVVAILAVIAITALLVFRLRAKVSVKGPFNTGVDVDASNEAPTPTPGVRVERAKSMRGGLTATDRTGRGADVREVSVYRDIDASSAPPETASDPKARPPTP